MKRNFVFKSEILISIGVILASMLVVWVSWVRIDTYRQAQTELLVDEVNASAIQIELFLDQLNNFSHAFANDHAATLAQMLVDPEDEKNIELMRAKIRTYLPDFLDFTIAGPDDVFSPDPLGTFVGEQCMADIDAFEDAYQTKTGHGRYHPYIHPQPGHYHFDMMAPWEHPQSGRHGVFFVSFPGEQLTKILQNFERAGHTISIMRADVPTLIEVFPQGVRDKLDREFNLSEQEMEQVVHKRPVRNSRWMVYGGFDEMLFDRQHRGVIVSALSVEAGLLTFYLLSMYVIVTSRRREEVFMEDLQDAKRQAENANMAKSDFLSSMSHELRTPLHAVLGFCQLLKNSKKEQLNEAQGKWVSQIQDAGQHLLHLIDDLLEFSRLETGNLRIKKEVVALSDCLEDVMPLVSEMAKNRDVVISFTSAQKIMDCRVLGDRLRLKQILLNLMSNAIKYNVEGGKVTVSCVTVRQNIRISVRDTGQGIAPDKHQDLFKSFNRLGAENSEVDGIGIGLKVCKDLIELMDGRIGFESLEDHGSTFWIDLPKP